MKRLLATMAALLLTTSASAAPVECDWSNPGHNPYTGTAWAAVMGMDHLTVNQKVSMLAAMLGKPHDKVAIGRDISTGTSGRVYTQPRDMVFGAGSKCSTVTMRKWGDMHVEVADAWCVGSKCVIKPEVCGNFYPATFTETAESVRRGALLGVRGVPEPSSILLVSAALMLLTRRGR